MLYPIEKRADDSSQTLHQVDGQFELFLALELLIRRNMKVVSADRGYVPQRIADEEGLSTCLASTLLKALSYINLYETRIDLMEPMSHATNT